MQTIQIFYAGPVMFVDKFNGYFEESNENKYLMLVPTDESKDTKKIWRNVE